MNPQHQPDQHALVDEQVSALCDGHLDGHELDQLLDRSRPGDGIQARWQSYQLIGDVLRGQQAGLPAQAPSAFLARLHASLQADEAAQPTREPVVVVALPQREEAANDHVFRWKLVSGFASVVAVAAIGWNVLAITAPSDAGRAQLAQDVPAGAASVQAVAAPTPAATPTRPLVVATPQGRVIRDAALERLLAEHRQHGGMSAFQNSTGFIRNATYDADAR